LDARNFLPQPSPCPWRCAIFVDGALSVYAAATISAHAVRSPFFAISTEIFAKKTKIFWLSTQFFAPNLLQNAQMFAIIKWKYFFTAQTAIHEKISEE
jgi:hypothetical protein